MRRCHSCGAPVPDRSPPSEELSQVVAELRTITRRLEFVEDRLDRKNRPYGDGTRHDTRKR